MQGITAYSQRNKLILLWHSICKVRWWLFYDRHCGKTCELLFMTFQSCWIFVVVRSNRGLFPSMLACGFNKRCICDLCLSSEADFLIRQVKDGFGSALLTHLDSFLGFSLIPVLLNRGLMSALTTARHYSCDKIWMFIDPIYLSQLHVVVILCQMCLLPQSLHDLQMNNLNRYFTFIVIPSVVGGDFDSCPNIVFSPLLFDSPSYPRAQAWCKPQHTLGKPKRISDQIHSDYYLLFHPLFVSLPPPPHPLSASLLFYVYLRPEGSAFLELHLDKDKAETHKRRQADEAAGLVAFKRKDNVSWPRPWWLPVIHGWQLH